MSKHTPGTWAWYDREGNEPATDFSELGLTLRTVEIYKDEIRIAGQTPFDMPKFILTIVDEVSEADAKLIVKAPKLLAQVIKDHDSTWKGTVLTEHKAGDEPKDCDVCRLVKEAGA